MRPTCHRLTKIILLGETMECTIAVIGGSGLYQMDGVEIEREERVATPYGEPSDVIRIGKLDGVAIMFLPRHGRQHAISPSRINYRANIWALKHLGVNKIISVSAVGSMREEIVPGDLVLIDQFIDRTRNRVSTFFDDGIVAHVSFADPICAELSNALYSQAAKVEAKIHKGGAYVCIEGPMFSTRAESHMYRSWGANVIGMTNLQEAKLAREAEIAYATIALATDYDCWRNETEACDAHDIMAVMQKNVANAQNLIRAAIKNINKLNPCSCNSALTNSIVTKQEFISATTRKNLEPIIGKYVNK